MRGQTFLNWEERWAGLAQALESWLSHATYQRVLCWATITLSVSYAYVGSRLAEPSLLNETVDLDVSLSESAADLAKDALSLDQLNRQLVRVERIRAQLPFSPMRRQIQLTRSDLKSDVLAARVLRLWFGEYVDENLVVEQEAVIRATLQMTGGSPSESDGLSTWYESVRSLHGYCKGEIVVPLGWDGLCDYVLTHPQSAWAKAAAPISLSAWLARELILDARTRPLSERATILSRWMTSLRSVPAVDWPKWPVEKSRFGERLAFSLKRLAPSRTVQFSAEPVRRTARANSADELRTVSRDVRTETVVLFACSSPRWSQLEPLRARHFVWVRRCGGVEEISLEQLASSLPWVDRMDRFAMDHPNLSFIEIGLNEMQLALKKRWIESQDFVDASVQFDGLMSSARPTNRIWLQALGAYRFKAPVDVVKLMRLQTQSQL